MPAYPHSEFSGQRKGRLVEDVDDEEKPDSRPLVVHRRTIKRKHQSDWIRFEIPFGPQVIAQMADFFPRRPSKRDKSHRSWMDFNP